MCTVSWHVDKNSYKVFFNRDESKGRATALPPEIYTIKSETHSQSHIMPLDPEGGGSWLAVNEYGLVFALLNFYQGRLPKGRLRSRGEIVKEIVSSRSVAEALAWLQALNLEKFPPFSLLVFTPELMQVPAFQKTQMFCWNGKQLSQESKSSPLFSSAIDFDLVRESREKIYKTLILAKDKVDDEDFLQLHKSHLPEKSRISICMHRDDASTVSFSQVTVSPERVDFYYADGAPCQAVLQKAVSLPRQHLKPGHLKSGHLKPAQ